MNGNFDYLQLYTSDVLLWHVINLFHSLQADWSHQTAENQQYCMAHTNYAHSHASEYKKWRANIFFSLPYAKLWKKQGSSQCITSSILLKYLYSYI